MLSQLFKEFGFITYLIHSRLDIWDNTKVNTFPLNPGVTVAQNAGPPVGIIIFFCFGPIFEDVLSHNLEVLSDTKT